MNQEILVMFENNGIVIRNAATPKDERRKTRRAQKIQRKTTSLNSFPSFLKSDFDFQQKQQKLCRVCLNSGDIPIYGDESIENLSESLFFYGGIEVHENDNLPKYLCYACQEQLQSAIMFRKTAVETDKILRESTIVGKQEYKVTVKQEYLDGELFKETLADLTTKYHCNLCKENFMNSNEYGIHMMNKIHAKVKDRCPFCNRKFNYIKEHLGNHRKYKTVRCDICTQKYLEPLLERHKKTHFISLNFKCTECPYETRYSGDFKVHMRKHTGERPFQCEHCPATFISKSNLNRHSFSHNEHLPYLCNQCDRGFHNEQGLNMHIAADHLGVRDYLCNICGKAFGYRKSMVKHQRQVHKREKLISGRKRAFFFEHQD